MESEFDVRNSGLLQPESKTYQKLTEICLFQSVISSCFFSCICSPGYCVHTMSSYHPGDDWFYTRSEDMIYLTPECDRGSALVTGISGVAPPARFFVNYQHGTSRHKSDGEGDLPAVEQDTTIQRTLYPVSFTQFNLPRKSLEKPGAGPHSAFFPRESPRQEKLAGGPSS